MKKNIFFIISAIIMLFSITLLAEMDKYFQNEILDNQYFWHQKADYKQIIKKTDQIVKIKFSDDGKNIFTIHRNGYYRHWNVDTGNLVFEKKLTTEKIQTAEIAQNGEKVFVYPEYSLKILYYYKILDEISDIKIDYGEGIAMFSNFTVFYLTQDEKKLITNLHITFYSDYGKYIQTGNFYNAINVDDLSIENYKKEKLLQISPKSNYYVKEFDLYNNNDIIYNFNNKIKHIRFSEDEKLILLYDSLNQFSIFEIENPNINYSKIDMSKKVYSFSELEFQNLSNYFYTFYNQGEKKLNQLEFYTIKGFNNFHTLEFEEDFIPNNLAFEKSNEFLVLSSSDGNIRLYQLDVLLKNNTIDFIASDIRNYKNVPITFYNNSQKKYLDFKWDFGDGNISFEKEPVHSYTSPGLYSIKLIAWNGVKFDTLVKEDYITIVEDLYADFEMSVDEGYLPLTIEFYNKSKGDIKLFRWNFEINGRSFDENSAYTFKNFGLYNNLLIIHDGIKLDTMTKTVFIKNPPIIDHTVLIEKHHRLNGIYIDEEYINHTLYKKEFDIHSRTKFYKFNLINKKNELGYIISSNSKFYYLYGDYGETKIDVNTNFILDVDNNGEELNRLENSLPIEFSYSHTFISHNNNSKYFCYDKPSNYILVYNNNLERINSISFSEPVVYVIELTALANDTIIVCLLDRQKSPEQIIFHKYYWSNPEELLTSNNTNLLFEGKHSLEKSKLINQEDTFALFSPLEASQAKIEIMKFNTDLDILRHKYIDIKQTDKLIDVIRFKDIGYALLLEEKKDTLFKYSIIFLENYFNKIKTIDLPEQKGLVLKTFCEFNDYYFLLGGKLNDTAIFYYVNNIDGEFYEYMMPNRLGSVEKVIKESENVFVAGVMAKELIFIKLRLDKSITNIIDSDFNQYKIDIFPNPTSDILHIKTDALITNSVLTDILGRTIFKQIGNVEQISTAGLAPGLYLLKLYTAGGEVLTKKVVVR